MNPQLAGDFFQTYMRSSGLDTKATMTINVKNEKPIKNKREMVPRWFPQYFNTSLSRQLGLPYSTQMKDLTGWNAHIPPALSMVDAFKKESYPNPADVFKLFKVQPGTLSGSDAVRLQQLLRDSFAFTNLDAKNSLTSSSLDQTKTSTQQLILGEPQNNGEGAFSELKNPPVQVTDQMDKFKKTIAEAIPFMDQQQAAAMINFVSGKAEDGLEQVDDQRALASNPNPMVAAQTLVAKPGYRTIELMKGVGRQIKMGKKLPVPYVDGQMFRQSAQQVALEQKFFKKTLMMQRKQLDSSRFA